MHFCTAYVAIGGDAQQVVFRGCFNPVSWPEIEVLRFVHGGDAIANVRVIAEVEQSPAEEKERLVQIYGAEPLKEVFPGYSPKMDMEAPRVTLPGGILWKNPLTAQHETTEGEPEAPPPPPVKGKRSQANEASAF